MLPVPDGYCEGCEQVYTGRGLCPMDPEHTVIEVDLANERLVASVIAHSRARREREAD